MNEAGIFKILGVLLAAKEDREQLEVAYQKILQDAADLETELAERRPEVANKATVHEWSSPFGLREAIDNLILMGNGGYKLNAVKEYRAATGVPLKEAKDAVERLFPACPPDVPYSIRQAANDRIVGLDEWRDGHSDPLSGAQTTVGGGGGKAGGDCPFLSQKVILD